MIALIEYFIRRLEGRTLDASKLFLYKVTRNLRNKQRSVSGDTGADLRTTLKALCRFGLLEEEQWPYEPESFDDEPSSFLYQVARPIERINYFSISHAGSESQDDVWNRLTSFLAAGFPVAFGFSVPSSLSADASIPCRPSLDTIRGGQAALAVGYEKHAFGRNHHALIIRSSWGSQWGDNGYGFLPARFVRAGCAANFWTLLSEKWDVSNELSRPVGIDL